ncbi:MAG: hypothetical protein RSE07_06885, partial [Oscillospiraceae bacterium]
ATITLNISDPQISIFLTLDSFLFSSNFRAAIIIIILIGIIVNIIVQTTSAGLNLSPMAYKISFGASMGIVLSLTMFIPSKKK